MKDKTTHLYVDGHERTLILHSLVELKNALIRQGSAICSRKLFFQRFYDSVGYLKRAGILINENGGNGERLMPF